MATINLGRIKPVNKGVWSNSTAYAVDDFVQYTDNGITSTYIAIATSTNQAPSTSGTENSTYWKFMAKGVADSLAGISNNKIIYKDNSGAIQGLTYGSTGEALKVTGANTLGFGSAGTTKQIAKAQTGLNPAISSANDGGSHMSQNMDVTNGVEICSVTLTTQGQGALEFHAQCYAGTGGNGTGFMAVYCDGTSGITSQTKPIAVSGQTCYSGDVGNHSIMGYFDLSSVAIGTAVKVMFRNMGSRTGNTTYCCRNHNNNAVQGNNVRANLIVKEI